MPGPIAPIPSPRTWASGPVLAPSLRADVSDAVAFLSYRPLGIFANQSGTSWAQGADTSLGCPVEFYDNWNGHNGASVSQYFAQAPGWYLCKSIVPFVYSGATQFMFRAGFTGLVNGVTMPVTSGPIQENASQHFPAPVDVDLIEQVVTGPIGGTGDYIQPTAFQGTTGAINIQNSTNVYPYFSVRWVALNTGTTGLPVPANPAWVSPPSFVTSAFLNANIRDTIRFLLYPPIAKAIYTPGSTTLPSQTFPAGTVINLTTVVVDNYGGITTGASGGYTAPVTGNYYVYGQFNIGATAAGGSYGAGLSVAGGTTMWGDVVAKSSDTAGAGAGVGRRLRLTAGQQVQLVGTQNTGAAVAYDGAAVGQTRLVVVWEGA
jgi:hypothetical protein